MTRRFTALILMLMLLATVFTGADAETIKLAYSNGSLKLRGGPGTSYSVKAYLSNGDWCTVLSKGSVWSKIKIADGTVGYVKNLYISGNGSSYASGTTYYSSKYTAYVKTKYANSKVNLRAGASSSTKSMGTLRNGTKVIVLGKNGSWYLISTSNGTQGYISTSYISKSKSSSTVTATVTGSVVYMRSKASSSSNVVVRLAKGTKVTVLSTSNSKWWKVKYGSYTGYMYSKYLKK